MTDKTADEKRIIPYLLGDLSNEDRTQLEETIFTDDATFDDVLAMEDELIDTYVRGELSESERERFETQFLASPQRRQRVEFARALLRTVSRLPKADLAAPVVAPPEPVPLWRSLLAWVSFQKPAIKFSFAALALLVIVGGPWLTKETMRLRTQLEQLQGERQVLREREQDLEQKFEKERMRRDTLLAQLQRERDQRAQLERELAKRKPLHPVIISFILSPGLVRDMDRPKQLVIPPAAERIQLQLDLEAGKTYRSYRALIRTADGSEVWSRGMLPAHPTDYGKAVILSLPAHLFTKGAYVLVLFGMTADGHFEEVGDYHFSVMKN